MWQDKEVNLKQTQNPLGHCFGDRASQKARKNRGKSCVDKKRIIQRERECINALMILSNNFSHARKASTECRREEWVAFANYCYTKMTLVVRTVVEKNPLSQMPRAFLGKLMLLFCQQNADYFAFPSGNCIKEKTLLI